MPDSETINRVLDGGQELRGDVLQVPEAEPLVYYAGAASGGIFKSIDGGIHWEPIFDAQPVSSIGSLAIAPSDPNVVWADTGETFMGRT
jgi:hypothetical protein